MNLPNVVEMEKKLLSAMLMKDGLVVPAVSAILEPDDFYRAEHKILFRAISSVFFSSKPVDILVVEQELRNSGDLDKISRSYLFSILDMEFTTARAEFHAKTIKEKSDLRKLILTAQIAIDDAQRDILPPAQIIAEAQHSFDQISRDYKATQKSSFGNFFADHFKADIDDLKAYSERKSGFDNLDATQFFSPGLYVIGATPAAGKTTFCWQLLEQLARRGESCIYCSYEMSRLELFTKSLARNLFQHMPDTDITAADIRRGAWSAQMDCLISEFAASDLNLHILELQDESIDDLLALLRPFCADKAKAPVVCLDYLQIVPTSRESTKLGIDDSVRKLKKFQRDTNTTFFVISSFNRTNYAHSVSFESFKESGNIEYTADVVWALQLFILNSLDSFNTSENRKKIDKAKKQQPRQIQLKCLKNRQGTNYECFFQYHSAHDCFVPCRKEDFKNCNHNNDEPDFMP